MKLWIRLEADAPRDPAVGHLAELLSIHPRQAFGHVVAVWCAMGEHAPDGSLNHVSHATIEDWAGWIPGRGRRAGDFARAFLTIFTEGGVDAEYAEQQGALVRRMERDRARKHPGNSTENPRKERGVSTATERNGTEQKESPSSAPALDATLTELLERLPATYRADAAAFFASIPNAGPFIADAAATLDGMPGHHLLTPEQLGGAIREYYADGHEPKLSHFRGYLQRAGASRNGSSPRTNGSSRPSRNGSAPRQYEYTPTTTTPTVR